MSRRARGEGTVVRDGTGWVARIELPLGPDGKRRRRKKRARTKTEAHRLLKELQRDYDDAFNPDGASRTVAEAVQVFLDIQPREGRSKHTIYLDEWRASMIVDGLGQRQLGDLTVRDCDEFLVRVAQGDFGRRTINRDGVNRTRRLLIKVINNEQRIGNLARNVADLSVMPVIAATNPEPSSTEDEDGEHLDGNRRSLTVPELQRFRSKATQPYLAIVDLIGRNGLRPSEARALRWECVDLAEQTLTVNRQMSSADQLTDTKTKRARRTIPLDEQTIHCLEEWGQVQDERIGRSGNRWGGPGRLVISTRYGTPVNRNNLKRSTFAISERAGLEPVLPYELRHTAITLQLDAGHEMWRVADWAGTSERMIEEVYRHRLSRISDLSSVALH